MKGSGKKATDNTKRVYDAMKKAGQGKEKMPAYGKAPKEKKGYK
jgi:hypothetical protein